MLRLLLSLLVASAASAANRPNVLLLMADDLRDFGGAFTSDVVKTPNLDRLRAHGTTFERAYVQYPVCNPSRSALLSGLRAEQTGIVDNNTLLRLRMPDIVTLPQLCKQAGWQCTAFGKITHLGGNTPEQKQRWMDAGPSWHHAEAFSPVGKGRDMIESGAPTGGKLKWCHWGMADGTDDDQPDGQSAAATVKLITESPKAQPWFIACGFHKPHDPFIAPKHYFDLYPLDTLNIWKDPADTTPAPAQAVGFGDFGTAFAKFTEREWKELFRAYCAGTSFMDAQLGRVLDALDRTQQWENTIVIFVGDHGYHTGERVWWNKNTLFERSARAPLIVSAPGAKGGQRSQSLVEFIDLYATVADYCGLQAPHPLAGTTLRPVLTDPTAKVKDAAYTLVTRGPSVHGQSVRTQRWRFTQWSSGESELYDHSTDPEELHNVAKENPTVVAEHLALLRTLPAYKPEPAAAATAKKKGKKAKAK